MNTNLLKLFSSFSILCLAVSLAFLSYSILVLVDSIPVVLDDIESTTGQIKPVIEQTEKITNLMPQILEEVKLVREQIPPILVEVKATREVLPLLLAEWQVTRNDTIPAILQETSAIRSEIKPILQESQGYRALVPLVLIESQNIRAALPVTLTRVEGIVTQAETIATSAGENAVTGLFAGILKAPFQLLKGVGNTIFPDDLELTKEDKELIENNAAAMLAQSALNEKQTYYNAGKTLKIVLEVKKEFNKDQRLCRVLSVYVKKERKHSGDTQITACRSVDGTWSLDEP